MNEQLLIGAVAAACGVSADTIRHYESKGVLTGIVRDASGYRRYTNEAIERVRVVRRALAIGFTLDELARIFRQRDSGKPPCENVHRLAQQKLAELDERIETLTALRGVLANSVAEWESKLRTRKQGEAAHLLESLK